MASYLYQIALSLCFGLFAIVVSGQPPAVAQVDVPAAVEEKHRADTECEDHDIEHMVNARQGGKLDEHRSVYLLPCFSGAYNIIYRIYVFDRRYPEDVQPTAFAGYSDELGWYGQLQLINAEFDANTKTLSAFEKGRGLGDCGSVPTYKWNEYGWRMIEYRYWGKCDGSRMPEDWPVIFDFRKRATAR